MNSKFMREALKEAHKAGVKDEVPVGAVVVFEDKIIARGHNTRESKNSVLGHAELVAMAKASRKLKSWRLVNCDVYVTLEPCPMCAAALQQARVRKVYYGVADLKAGAVSLGFDLHQHKKLNHRFEMQCVGPSECGEVLSLFFKKKRNRC